MRDARINTIGEGANDVLHAFIAVVGMRGVGESLKGVLKASKNPFREFSTLWRFGTKQVAARFSAPEIPVRSAALADEARELAKRVRDFGLAVQRMLEPARKAALKNGDKGENEELLIGQEIIKGQYAQERIADMGCDLYASSCTLSRLDHLLTQSNGNAMERERDVQAGHYFLRLANRRILQNLTALGDNDDALTTATADAALAGGRG